ncbi:DUF5700 domain-containing putative Zn-dependent protease [Hymenobacter bucti]|uniref:DUF5700 domain-containing putative Zn-dependent protease n=1 Tax=Hymenobacter bucti TaxID=1844114 RepID=A0ABW4QP18_9BACT
MTSYFTRLLLLTFLLITSLSHAQTIDIESATRYWQLTDALRRNEPLTDQAWQSFLALPGNKIYVDAVYNDEQLARYRRAIEVAYMPRYDSLRQAKIKANVWYYVLANDYKEHEAEDRRYVAAMQQNPDYLGRMYTYAYEALPARNHTKVANLKIYYVMLGNDATSQQTGLVFSMRSVRDGNATKPGILEAHEMHHQLRTTSTHYEPTNPADDNLLWAFYSALNEGTADFTDKVPRLANPADSAEIRSWLLRPAPAVIQKIDSTIRVQAAGGAATPLKFYRRLTNGTNGHLPGFYMASTHRAGGLPPAAARPRR